MIFAVVLGLMIGAAGVLLVQQWARDSLRTPTAKLPRERFPRLAPPQAPGHSQRVRRAA
jgi:hypothetical protein